MIEALYHRFVDDEFKDENAVKVWGIRKVAGMHPEGIVIDLQDTFTDQGDDVIDEIIISRQQLAELGYFKR